jgi:3D (Asp-Asp-Asp) domain-containing protein
MFRQCVCSLVLAATITGATVESAQAASSPTTRTHGSRIAQQSKGCVKRTHSQRRAACGDRTRRHAQARHQSYSMSPAQSNIEVSFGALGVPQTVPGNIQWHGFRCDRRYLNAAKTYGATKTQKYLSCKTQLSQRRIAPQIPSRGYWATYETTAYCLTGTTASGTYTHWGTVASTLPFGTQMYIPGYGDGTAEDTGGAVGAGHVDLWMPSCSEAIDWGVRYEKIEIFS